MIRPLRPLIAIVALAGCQQPGPATDPFLYRSTIPPPGTAISCAPGVTPGPQPYYSPPPAAVAGSSPCTPDTPAPCVQPAPVAPATVPVVPPLPQRYFPSRGGFDFPQSSNGPPPAGLRDANVEVAADRPDPSMIRIVEPGIQSGADMPAGGLANPIIASGTPTNPSPANSPQYPPPNLLPNSSSSSLPAVVPAAAVVPLAGDSPPTVGTSVIYPGDHTGVNYGYDPGYKALRGKLDYSVTARLWRLRYLPMDGPIDEYGGTVVIADSRQVNGFEPGDFVAVQGSLSPPTAGDNSATYAISRIKRQ